MPQPAFRGNVELNDKQLPFEEILKLLRKRGFSIDQNPDSPITIRFFFRGNGKNDPLFYEINGIEVSSEIFLKGMGFKADEKLKS